MDNTSGTTTEFIQENSSLQQEIKELKEESSLNRVGKTVEKKEEYFKAIIQNSYDVILVMDNLARITYASPSVQRALGYSPEELIGTRAFKLIVSDDMPRAIEDFRWSQSVKDTLIPNTFRIKHQNGSILIFEGVGSNLLDNSAVKGFVMNIRDITDRTHAEKELQKGEERYRALVESASDIVYRLDKTGHLTFVNPSGIRVTGYVKAELIGKNYSIFIRPDMRDEAIKFFGRQFAKRTKNIYSEYPILTKNGDEVWLGQNTQLIEKNGEVIGFQAVSRNITNRKRIERELEESEKKYKALSIIDGLTQLYNSRHFYAQLKIEIERSNRYGQPLTLLVLDLDDFKVFNDTYGHIEGDQVLFQLGLVVKKCLRHTDSAYRYGGEEFTIILPMTTNTNGIFTAERIRKAFKKISFSPVPDQSVQMTVSTGLAQYKTGEDITAFVTRVDQLMYTAKKKGKDCVVNDSSSE